MAFLSFIVIWFYYFSRVVIKWNPTYLFDKDYKLNWNWFKSNFVSDEVNLKNTKWYFHLEMIFLQFFTFFFTNL